MRRQVIECDRCGRICEHESLYPCVGFQSGPTGQEKRIDPIDLCAQCMRTALQDLLNKLSHEDAAAWVKKQREKRKVNSYSISGL